MNKILIFKRFQSNKKIVTGKVVQIYLKKFKPVVFFQSIYSNVLFLKHPIKLQIIIKSINFMGLLYDYCLKHQEIFFFYSGQ